jgi:hypothetical protein
MMISGSSSKLAENANCPRGRLASSALEGQQSHRDLAGRATCAAGW